VEKREYDVTLNKMETMRMLRFGTKNGATYSFHFRTNSIHFI